MNTLILSEFKKLVKQIKIDIDQSNDKNEKKKHQFRLKQTLNIIKIIENYNEEIKKGEDIAHLKGIGAGTVNRINEILSKGKLSEIKLTEQKEKYLEQIKELEQIIGIGRKTAIDLIKIHNIKSIEQLKKAYQNNDIELNELIKIGIKYHGVYKENIPREEITLIDNFIHDVLYQINKELHGIICGSYRRLKMISNDIDLLVTHADIKNEENLKNTPNYLHKIINKLKKVGFLVDDMTYDDPETKYMGFCKYKDNPVRRIDIVYVPQQSYYSALLYFTGSGNFNAKMRNLAKDLGYKLNEYGLFKIKGEEYIRMQISSEKDIFDYLGMEYVTPDKR